MCRDKQLRFSTKVSLIVLLFLGLAWTASTHSGEVKGEKPAKGDPLPEVRLLEDWVIAFGGDKPAKDASLPEGALARLGKVDDARAVDALAYSPDGKTLVSAHQDRSLCIWDAVNFKLLRRFRGPEKLVTSIVYSPDSKDFMTASEDNCAAVWEVAGGRKALALQVAGQRLLHVAYTADGHPSAFFTDEKHIIRQYDVASGAEQGLYRGHTEKVLAAALSPNGRVLASSSEDKNVILWNAEARFIPGGFMLVGQEIAKLKPNQDVDGRRARMNFEEPVDSLRFAPNGWTLYGGVGEQTYFLWDMDSNEVLMAANSSAPVDSRAKAFSPDGQLLLYAVDGLVGDSEHALRRNWSEGLTLANFQVLGTFIYRNQEKVTSLAFSPDGRRLASGVADGTVMIWDRDQRISNHRPRQFQVATTSHEQLELLWNALGDPVARQQFEARWMFTETGSSGVAFLKKKLPPARNLAVEKVRNLIAELDADDPVVRARTYAELEALGSSIATELRKTIASRPAPEIKQKAEMLLEAFDPPRMRRGILILEQMHTKESRQVLQDLADGVDNAWQTHEAKAALKRLARRPEPLPPPPVATVAAAAEEAKVEVPARPIKMLETIAPQPAPQPGFDATGDPLPAGALLRLGSMRMRHRGSANSVLFSQDGKSVISSGSDGLIRFWDPATGKEQRQFPVQIGANTMTLSADGKTLLTGGKDLQIACWDLATGQERGRFSPEIYGVLPFHVSPDLRLVICNGTIWDAATGRPWRQRSKAPLDRAMAFSEGGKTVILDSDRGLCLHDLATGLEVRRLTGPGRRFIGCSRDGKLLVARNAESFVIVDIATGRMRREIAGHESIQPFMQTIPPVAAAARLHGNIEFLEEVTDRNSDFMRYFNSCVLSADAKTIAVFQGAGHEAHLLDLATGRSRMLALEQQSYFLSMAFSPDSKLLAVALADGRVRLWNVASGQPQLDFPRYFGVGGVLADRRLSADGKTLAGVEPDGRIGLWDLDSGRLRGRLGAASTPRSYQSVGQSGEWVMIAAPGDANPPVIDVSWSSKGSRMLTLNADGEAFLWDTADGQLLWRVKRGGNTLIGFSNDDKVFATIFGDGVKLYAAGTGKELRRITTPGGALYAAALHPSGQTVATFGNDSNVYIWDVASGKETHRFELGQGYVISAFEYTPDGKMLAIRGSDGFISFWDTAAWSRVRRVASSVESPGFLAFSPDGKLLATRDDVGGCVVLDGVSGKLLHRIDTYDENSLSACFTPDSRRVITTGTDGIALVWDLTKLPAAAASAPAPKSQASQAKGVLTRIGQPGDGANVWLAYDARTLLSREADGAFRLQDLASGKELRRYANLGVLSGSSSRQSISYSSRTIYQAIDDDWNLSGAFNRRFAVREVSQTERVELSPDGKLLVGWGSSSPSIGFWDAASGEKLQQIVGHAEGTASLAQSPDGKLIATSGNFNNGGPVKDFAIRIWEMPSGRLKQKLPGHKNSGAQLTFSPDGKFLLSCSSVGAPNGQPASVKQDILVWNLTTGKLVRQASIPALWLQFSPDGRTIAYHSGDNLFLWDMIEDRFLPRPQVKRGFSNCIFSYDAKMIATTGDDDPIRWWEVATGKELGAIDERGAMFVGFSRDAKMLVTTKGSAVRTWDLTTRREIRPLPGHREVITALAISPDKRTIVSGSGDMTVRVWDAKSGKELRCLTGHKEWLTNVAFAPDGRSFASADQGDTVIIWDAATGKERRRIPGSGKLNSSNNADLILGALASGGEMRQNSIAALVFSTDGKSLIAANRQATVWKWDVETGKKTTLITSSPEAAAARMNNGFSLSPNGQWLGTCEFAQIQVSEEVALLVGMIRIWDVNTGKLVRTITGPDERFDQLMFSPDGKQLLARTTNVSQGGMRRHYSYIEAAARVRIWEVETGQEIRSTTLANTLGFSFHGDSLINCNDASTLAFWDIAAGQERLRPTGLEIGGLSAHAYSPDGSCLALASDRMIVMLDANIPAMRQPLWPAATPRPLEDHWFDLAGDAARAFDSIQFLASNPAESVPFLAKHLRPAAVPEQERLDKLLLDLDSNRYAVRQAAERELEALEEEAAAGLHKILLKSTLSPDARGRVGRLLNRLENGPSAEQLRHLRAISVLTRIGTTEARDVLRSLAGGAASSRVTREARVCLERLEPRR